jgi:hypothetical protein
MKNSKYNEEEIKEFLIGQIEGMGNDYEEEIEEMEVNEDEAYIRTTLSFEIKEIPLEDFINLDENEQEKLYRYYFLESSDVECLILNYAYGFYSEYFFGLYSEDLVDFAEFTPFPDEGYIEVYIEFEFYLPMNKLLSLMDEFERTRL